MHRAEGEVAGFLVRIVVFTPDPKRYESRDFAFIAEGRFDSSGDAIQVFQRRMSKVRGVCGLTHFKSGTKGEEGHYMTHVPQEVVWLVAVVLTEAAIIDWKTLKVPNWLTFHFLFAGLAYWAWQGGWSGFGHSLAGAALGLAVLMPLYSIGGMGAGDCKLYAGFGAWVGMSVVLSAFVVSAVVGGVIALGMIAWSGNYARYWAMGQTILNEIVTIRNPAKLSELAAARKPSMTLLPYGIPLCIGSVAYCGWTGMFF